MIKPLELVPDSAPVIARWIESEWGRLPIHNYFEAVAKGTDAGERLLPRTLVEVRSGSVVGTVSLLHDDMDIRPDLNPWLGCLFVEEGSRSKGIGTELALAAERLARDLKIRNLYLFTVNSESLYAKLGWISFDKEHYEGKTCILMKRDLGRAS